MLKIEQKSEGLRHNLILSGISNKLRRHVLKRLWNVAQGVETVQFDAAPGG